MSDAALPAIHDLALSNNVLFLFTPLPVEIQMAFPDFTISLHKGHMMEELVRERQVQ